MEDGPATSTTLTRDDALKIYHEMVTIRRMETAAANLYKEKAIRGFCHLCSGQEAIYSGMKVKFVKEFVFLIVIFLNQPSFWGWGGGEVNFLNLIIYFSCEQ